MAVAGRAGAAPRTAAASVAHLARPARVAPVHTPCATPDPAPCPLPPPPLNPPIQANNNLGLVLQDLSSLRPAAERAAYLRHSLHKFRRAIRLRPDFDRACEWAGLRCAGLEVAACVWRLAA